MNLFQISSWQPLLDAFVEIMKALLLAVPGVLAYYVVKRQEKTKQDKIASDEGIEHEKQERELALKEKQWGSDLTKQVADVALTMIMPLREQNMRLIEENSEKDAKIDRLEQGLDDERAKRRKLEREIHELEEHYTRELDEAKTVIALQADKIEELSKKVLALEKKSDKLSDRIGGGDK